MTAYDLPLRKKLNSKKISVEDFYEALRNSGLSASGVKHLEFERTVFSDGIKFIYDVLMSSGKSRKAEIFIDIDGLIQASYIEK